MPARLAKKINLHIICILIILAHIINQNKKIMWCKSYSTVTKEATKEQMWKLISDVNNWSTWDESVAFAKLQGKFEQGNHFILQPKGGPKLKIGIVETVRNSKFVDFTRFPLAKMYGEHIFEDTEAGLKITTTMKIKGPLGFFWRKAVAQKIVDGLPHDTAVQIAAASKL
jgi:hypothetical protein